VLCSDATVDDDNVADVEGGVLGSTTVIVGDHDGGLGVSVISSIKGSTPASIPFECSSLLSGIDEVDNEPP